jgi:hypothetical protein
MEVLRNAQARFDLEEFLDRPLLAYVASFSDEGPRNSIFWYLWEDDAIWIILEEGVHTIQERIRGDPRVAVGFADFDAEKGFLQNVSIRGTASLEPWEDERAGRLLHRYYCQLQEYREGAPHLARTATGAHPMSFLRIIPESVFLREQSYRDRVLSK